MSNSKNILVLLTGSIATYKMCEFISYFRKKNFDIKLVASPSALKFVGQATLEGLTGHPVQTAIFEKGHMMDHIYLNKWADITVLAPATANSLNKLSCGLGDDLISSISLAREAHKKFIVAPAMNTQMYNHPTVQNSLKVLASWGMDILPTDNGRLACGDHGPGKLIDIETLIQKVESSLEPQLSPSRKRILITSGGTQEQIDGVRHIGNMSSGKTGAEMADTLSELGHQVVLLHGINSQLPKLNIKTQQYSDFKSLNQSIKEQLGQNHFDVVIHAAAVSDYSVDKLVQNSREFKPDPNLKLSSEFGLSIELKKNPKIVSRLKDYSINKKIKVFAFKLTQTLDTNQQKIAVDKIANNHNIDYVIHNDLLDIKNSRRFFNFYKKNKKIKILDSTKKLCQQINAELQTQTLNISPEVFL